MAKEGRNLLSIIFKNFLTSLKPKQFRGKLVGTDYFGNKYYEGDINVRNKPSRWFTPAGGDKNFDKEIPSEWEAWLRGRRSSPPTEEELERNYKRILSTKENAKLIEQEFPKEKKMLSDPPSGKVPFPKFDEYESLPGKSRQPK